MWSADSSHVRQYWFQLRRLSANESQACKENLAERVMFFGCVSPGKFWLFVEIVQVAFVASVVLIGWENKIY